MSKAAVCEADDRVRTARCRYLNRFADQMKSGISDSEVLIFEGCSHAPIYEKVEEVNQKTLAFLQKRVGSATVAA